MFNTERQMGNQMIIKFIMISILWIFYCLYSNNVNTFVAMFAWGASSFNQDLSGWAISATANLEYMLEGGANLSVYKYTHKHSSYDDKLGELGNKNHRGEYQKPSGCVMLFWGCGMKPSLERNWLLK